MKSLLFGLLLFSTTASSMTLSHDYCLDSRYMVTHATMAEGVAYIHTLMDNLSELMKYNVTGVSLDETRELIDMGIQELEYYELMISARKCDVFML